MQELIKTVGLKKYFKTAAGPLHAVDDVNLTIMKGQTLGVVGESGCGKTTLGRAMLHLLPVTDGQVLYNGRNILDCSKREMKAYRKHMQIIFQDPFSSLNPRLTVSELIAEPMIVNSMFKKKKDMRDRCKQLMEMVGLARRLENVYPHELDGGRRQRIGIARALASGPEFIVCDEPVSALDVSVQAQILNLLMDLQDSMGLTYMFITHDLSVVRHISTNIVVMYLGQCVEIATPKELFTNPLHPYTKALLAAVPMPNLKNRGRMRAVIKGEVTSPINPEPGCRFASRCDICHSTCMGEVPIVLEEAAPGHWVACIRRQES